MILPQVHLGESGLEAMINTVALEKRIAPSSISSSLLWALGLFERRTSSHRHASRRGPTIS